MSVDGVPIEYDMIASYVSVNKDHQSIAVRIDGYTGRIGGHIGVFFNGLENGVINDRLTTFTLTRLSLVSITSGQITYKKEGNLHVLTFDNVSVKESAIPYTTAKINGYVKLNETMGKK